MQRVPDVSTADVERFVQRAFRLEETAAVHELLDGLDYRTTAHVRLAALELAKGDVDRLRWYLVEGRHDWRDLLAEAESSVGIKVWLSRRYNDDPAFREAVDARDWAAYQV